MALPDRTNRPDARDIDPRVIAAGPRMTDGWPGAVALGATVLAALVAALVTSPTPAASQDDGLAVYISADMEGVTGAVTSEQLGPSGFEYGRFREFMTQEVLVAIAAARAAGATRILVSDSHGNGQNLLIERFDPEIEIIRSWPRPLMMMEGIDETFDAAIFLGYHSSTTGPKCSCANPSLISIGSMPLAKCC